MEVIPIPMLILFTVVDTTLGNYLVCDKANLPVSSAS